MYALPFSLAFLSISTVKIFSIQVIKTKGFDSNVILTQCNKTMEFTIAWKELPSSSSNLEKVLVTTSTNFYCQCNGRIDCVDGSDELYCFDTPECGNSTSYSCSNGACVDLRKRCNGMNDCGDWSDEVCGCRNYCRYLIFQLNRLWFRNHEVQRTWTHVHILLKWWPPVQRQLMFEEWPGMWWSPRLSRCQWRAGMRW